MHHKSPPSAGNPIRGLFIALVMGGALTAGTSASAETYSDSHCFKQAKYATAYPEDQYANGELQNSERVAAVEELIQRQWRLRLSEQPFRQSRDQLLNDDQGHKWWTAWSLARLESNRRLNEVRSGSKVMFVTPEMKRLARERSEIRNLKQKPCNPNMVYLGTN